MQRARVARTGIVMPLYLGPKTLSVFDLAEAFGQVVEAVRFNEVADLLRASRWIYAMLCGSLLGMQPQARLSLLAEVIVGLES